MICWFVLILSSYFVYFVFVGQKINLYSATRQPGAWFCLSVAVHRVSQQISTANEDKDDGDDDVPPSAKCKWHLWYE